MKKLTKTQVIAKLKNLDENETIHVTMFPSKCGPSNTTWVKGYGKELDKSYLDIPYPNNEDLKHLTVFDSIVNEFQYYNCIPELGKRVHFYINE